LTFMTLSGRYSTFILMLLDFYSKSRNRLLIVDHRTRGIIGMPDIGSAFRSMISPRKYESDARGLHPITASIDSALVP